MAKSIILSPAVKDYSVVIAIDFGTTRSGFIYCITHDGADEISTNDIHNFQDWGNFHGVTDVQPFAKNRTELLYSGKKVVDWGWGARSKKATTNDQLNLLSKFKLKLQEDQDYFEVNNEKFYTVDVIADYLTQMKKMIGEFLSSETLLPIPNEVILWCLTVPALWDDRAIDRMKKAAIKSRLVTEDSVDEQLLFVKEPEAAAVHCYFNSLAKTLDTGDSFMVVDAGGGTIDLTSYRISGDKKLEEIAKSSGGLHGSTYVDNNFWLYLDKRGLDVQKVFNDKKDLKLLINWENAKHSAEFNTHIHSITIPEWKYFKENHADFINGLLTEQDGNDTEIIISQEEFVELFNPSTSENINIYNPVFKGVKEDIQQHIASLAEKGIKEVDYVFLVGGFNRSKLLSDYIIENFSYITKNDKTRFIKPTRPEQAIMEGACIYALNPSIIHSRVSKKTYGLEMLVEFNSSFHDRSRLITINGKNYCRDVFNIMCRKNESIPYDHYCQCYYVPIQADQQGMGLEIFCADNENPYYTDEPGVKKLGDLPVNLPGYGMDRRVQVRFFFGKVDIKCEAENLVTKEVVKTNVRFVASYG